MTERDIIWTKKKEAGIELWVQGGDGNYCFKYGWLEEEYSGELEQIIGGDAECHIGISEKFPKQKRKMVQRPWGMSAILIKQQEDQLVKTEWMRTGVRIKLLTIEWYRLGCNPVSQQIDQDETFILGEQNLWRVEAGEVSLFDLCFQKEHCGCPGSRICILYTHFFTLKNYE